MLDYERDDDLPHAVPAGDPRRRDCRRLWPVRQLRRCLVPDRGRRRGAAAARASAGEGGRPDRAAGPVADGDGPPRRAGQGSDRADEAMEPGRALGRLSDLGWGQRLREVLREDAQASAEFCGPSCRCWPSGWASGRSPSSVCRRAHTPLLVASLAAGLAQIGRLPLLGHTRPRPRRAHRGARRQQRLPALRGLGALRRRTRPRRALAGVRAGPARRRPRLVAVDPHRRRAGAAVSRGSRRAAPRSSPSTADRGISPRCAALLEVTAAPGGPAYLGRRLPARLPARLPKPVGSTRPASYS
jgi:hypothetical protein